MKYFKISGFSYPELVQPNDFGGHVIFGGTEKWEEGERVNFNL